MSKQEEGGSAGEVVGQLLGKRMGPERGHSREREQGSEARWAGCTVGFVLSLGKAHICMDVRCSVQFPGLRSGCRIPVPCRLHGDLFPRKPRR